MFPVGVAAFFFGYALLYSGLSQLATGGKGTGLIAALGASSLLSSDNAFVPTSFSLGSGNGSGNLTGQPAAPTTPTTGSGGTISL